MEQERAKKRLLIASVHNVYALTSEEKNMCFALPICIRE